MKHLKPFHGDVLTVRSHQWKYYVEPYTGCALQCTYCLYWESPEFVQRLPPPPGLVAELDDDLMAMERRQIVYIGATIDPYQLLERKLRVTRQILELLLARRVPVVILTKSPLMLRDMDLLLALHRHGLVMVQFTVLTVDEAKARTVERAAPAVAQRLEAAAQLSKAGIPVHFHLSPVIPGFYQGGELKATVRAIADYGGQCIYANILGLRHLNTRVWLDSVAKLPPAVAARSRAAYARAGEDGNVYAPEIEAVHAEMAALQEICADVGVDFICEFIPGLDTFDPARFEEGIFRFGLPTVYQMVPLLHRSSNGMRWRDFAATLARRYPAVDAEYLTLVKELWADGQLFENRCGTRAAAGGARSDRAVHSQLPIRGGRPRRGRRPAHSPHPAPP